jgi:hypothetical protein
LSRAQVKWEGLTSAKDELKRSHKLYRDHARIRARYHCSYQYSSKCEQCGVKPICDGFHGDYASMFGVEEARPIKLEQPVEDPTFFIREQDKIYESEERQRPWNRPLAIV